MGRELKRVPLDFDWPLNTRWKGYINPYCATDCMQCDKTGYNPETRKIGDSWYSFDKRDWVYVTPDRRYNRAAWKYNLEQEDVQALLDADSLWDFTRVPINDEQREIVKQKVASGENSWLLEDNGYTPTAEEVNEWAKQGMGHDAINRSICIKAKAKRLGVYGLCPVCNGEGNYFSEDKYRQLAEEWKLVDPPKGDGYQLWETTSEGSPISPVFKTLDELCEWAAENATTFGSNKATKWVWLQMLDDGFVHHQEGNMVFI